MTSLVGSNLRALRGRLALSQDELAERSQVNVSTIRGIEGGLVTKPHAGTLNRLADALGVSIGELEPNPGPDPPPGT